MAQNGFLMFSCRHMRVICKCMTFLEVFISKSHAFFICRSWWKKDVWLYPKIMSEKVMFFYPFWTSQTQSIWPFEGFLYKQVIYSFFYQKLLRKMYDFLADFYLQKSYDVFSKNKIYDFFWCFFYEKSYILVWNEEKNVRMNTRRKLLKYR